MHSPRAEPVAVGIQFGPELPGANGSFGRTVEYVQLHKISKEQPASLSVHDPQFRDCFAPTSPLFGTANRWSTCFVGTPSGDNYLKAPSGLPLLVSSC